MGTENPRRLCAFLRTLIGGRADRAGTGGDDINALRPQLLLQALSKHRVKGLGRGISGDIGATLPSR